MKPQIIALYLPQFHPFPENEEWWGKGFTEWTNVGKARPLFKGHYQPRVPADLGYYDLRLPIVREQQAELAREAGVTAFCYWHYWFGGKRLMETIFQEVLDSGKPDFPFCLAWANHTWRAVGCTAGNYDPRVLMEQTYPGIEDAKEHMRFLIKAFRDERYLKIDGMPYLFIYDPLALPQEYVECFIKMTKEAGFPSLYLVANVGDDTIPIRFFTEKGYTAVNYSSSFRRNHERKTRPLYHKIKKNLEAIIRNRPKHIYKYKDMYPQFIQEIDKDERVIPQIMPNWDHSPRTGGGGNIFIGSTPELYKKHLRMAFEAIKDKPEKKQIIMLKSWNEWAEGNYMEPDLKYGKGYLKALRQVLDEYKDK